ncbi:MAG: Uma2 family endonuclease, partial [Pirellulales bacterium]
TAEEFLLLPDNGALSELYRGLVIDMNPPSPRHGQICHEISLIVGAFVREHGLGRCVSNDSGIITEKNPDTVRGADVAFYSYARVAKGPLPAGYLKVVPELVFEVISPSDRWSDLLGKVAEYLKAGVVVVCVLDPDTETAHAYRADRVAEVFSGQQALTLPDVLPEFSSIVARFFE